MLGKVFGPYNRPDGQQHVVVVLHNDDGSIKSKQTISYRKYMEQVDQGLHVYEKYERTFKEKIIHAPKIPYEFFCKLCKKHNLSNPKSRLNDLFCNDSCREKYKRKEKRKLKNIYYKQAVVMLKNSKEHVIVYNFKEGERGAYYVPINKCTTIITEDDNQIIRQRIHFDLKDAVIIKTVVGYKKYFWITESGILLSRRNRQILSQHLNDKGYLTHANRIDGRNGKNVCFRIHRCVAMAFIPNPENKPEVNHIDCIKTNNHRTNLEWATNQENIDHAVANNLMNPLEGIDSTSTTLTKEDVLKIRSLSGKISYRKIGILYSMCHQSVSDIINRLTFKNIP